MEKSLKGLVPASNAPEAVYPNFKPSYVSRMGKRFGQAERPVMFIDTKDTGEFEGYENVNEFMADLAKDDDLPKGTEVYVNGSYLTVKEAAKLDLVAYHYKNKGYDLNETKFQFWTDEAAKKEGLAFATSAPATASKKNKKATKRAKW